MAVKNGVAWTKETKFAKPYHKYVTRWERVPWTQRIILMGIFITLESEIIGGCDECHQMPCHHTAFLLGWTKEVKE
jgi:hypothetical protein